MRRFLDLQFIIGLFFTCLSLILLGAGLLATGPTPSGIDSNKINFMAGSLFFIFGALMLGASLTKAPEDDTKF